MWHKPCRTFHPWCVCIKTRCLYSCDVAPCHLASTQIVGTSDTESLNSLYSFVGGLFHGQYQLPSLGIRTAKQWLSTPGSEELDVVVVQYSVELFVIYDKAGSRRLLVLLFFCHGNRGREIDVTWPVDGWRIRYADPLSLSRRDVLILWMDL